MIKISASTHPAKENLLEYFKELEELSIDMLHCDVMDGKFVKDKTINHLDVAKINAISTIVLDVHLMVVNPEKHIKEYALAGANILTVHYEDFESKRELEKAINLIKQHHMLAGISIKPSTKIEEIKDLLPIIDLVLVMSVEPGKSGQEFIPSTIDKIKALKEEIDKNNYYCLIEVDGGVNKTNAKQLIKNGADILVVGSYLFNAEDKQKAIKDLRE
jgi:ribulose-phosphate 3-epimerase